MADLGDGSVYLGDGLYANHDGWQIELFAHNGIGKTNRVFLEPTVLSNFLGYVEVVTGNKKQEREQR